MKRTAIWFAVLVGITLVLAIWITDAWSLPEKLSFGGGDGMLGEALIKSIVENGLMGNVEITRMGTPQTSSIVDTPFLDWSYVILVYAISFFVSNPGRITVIFYVITFLTAAMSMFFLLKRLRCKNEIAVLFSLLFSFSTFHAYRNMGHMTLSNYFFVPLAIYLSFFIAGDETDDIVSLPFKKKRANQFLACTLAFLLGFVNIYYTAFGLIFMALAVIYRMVRTGKLLSNIKYLVYLALTCGGVLVALSPQIIHFLTQGSNPAGAVRSFANAEQYGLKIIQLIFPPSFSRIWGAAAITEKYQEKITLVSENYMSALGLIGTVAFFGLCGYFVYSFIKKKSNPVYDFSSLGVLSAILVATVGGFGTVFNFFVVAQIRCYCRISIFILCFCYLAFACKLSQMQRRAWVRYGVMAVLVVVAFFDQIPMPSVNSWDGYAWRAEMYDEFYSKVEESLDSGSMVYQLPFVEFPEPARTKMYDMDCYNPLSAYVFTDHIRWSHGGIKGRNDLAGSLYVDSGVSDEFVTGIQEAGFSGVCINISGYSQKKRESVLEFYNIRFGAPIVSSDGTLYFYKII